MSREEAFLQAMEQDPQAALIFADYLEEAGDPRGDLLRLAYILTFSVGIPNRPALEERVRQLVATGVRHIGLFWTNTIGMRFAWIPPGTFLMGSPASEAFRFVNEGPQHEVTISRPFHLGVHPVTQREYQAVTDKNPSHFGGNPENPVECVSWAEANSFCHKLSKLPREKAAGRVYRLPTEAEWEYACRAGTTTAYAFGESFSAEQANFDDALGKTSKVGAYPANAWGLYDMHGNVLEWCADRYHEKYYQNSPDKDPQGKQSGVVRVLRGGSWYCIGRVCRAADRYSNPPGVRDNGIGFRVACVVAPGIS